MMINTMAPMPPVNRFANTPPAANSAHTSATSTGLALNSGPMRFGATIPVRNIRISPLLKALDFQGSLSTTVNQMKLIYACIIASRFGSAFQRMVRSPDHSGNEMRETAVRDPAGFMLWIFGIPLLIRAFLNFLPKRHREALVHRVQPDIGNAKGIMAQFRHWNQRLNPLARWSIPTREVTEDWMHQALETLERAGHGKDGSAYHTLLKRYMQGPIRWRNFATGLGMLATIILLGLGVMYFNIRTTQRKNAAMNASGA